MHRSRGVSDNETFSDPIRYTAAGLEGTIKVTLKSKVPAAEADDPWVIQAFRTEIDPVFGAQACGVASSWRLL